MNNTNTMAGEIQPYSISDLTSITGSDLNFSLISLPAFICKNCSNFLYPPVMLLPNVGDVCGFCNVVNGVDVAVEGVRNTALEAILQHLAVPCRYYDRGCGKFVDFQEHEHLQICRYRDFNCPLKLLGACNWEGNLGCLLDHSLEDHLHSTIRGFRNCFTLNVDTSITSDVIKLLYTDVDKFVLRMKFDEEKIQFLLYFIGSKEKLSNLSYIIEQENLGNISNKYGTDILHESKRKYYFDENQALTIYLVFVKEFMMNSRLDLTIKVLKKSQTAYQLDNTLLSYFECPVCNTYMRPPIYQCLSGHSVCNQCRPKLHHCHTCRAEFGQIRNFSFEQLGDTLEFPCLYREGGCSTVLPVKDIVKHEMECSLQPYRCPLNDCHWKGVYSAIISHLRICHSKKITCNNYKAKHGKLNISNQFCMITQGQIFRVLCRFDVATDIVHWAVQLVGPKGYAKRFKYELGLINSINSNKKFIRSEICQDLSNDSSEIINKCISIPYSTVLQYVRGDEVLHYCRIIKVQFSN